MAYTTEANAIVEVQYRYTIAGQQCINVFHFEMVNSTIDGAGFLNEALAQWYLDAATSFQSYQTSEVTDINLRGQFVYPTRYVPVIYRPEDAVGGAAPPALTIGTSVVVKRTTDIASRSTRGRIYWGGVAKSYADVGTLTDAAMTEFTGNIASKMTIILSAAAGAQTANPVIWSYTHPADREVVEAGEIDRALRYQRRREVGRGI